MEEFNANLKISMKAVRQILLWAEEQGHIKEDAATILLQNMYEEAEKETAK